MSGALRCESCTSQVDDDDAHCATTRQCLDDGWQGDELWHSECCPYCSVDPRQDTHFHPV